RRRLRACPCQLPSARRQDASRPAASPIPRPRGEAEGRPAMRRALLVLAAVALLAAAPANAAEWHSEQPVAGGIGAPASIGEIGDIEFWAPNRGVLITAGNGGSAAGIFAYDGSGWYRYATVCGGTKGGSPGPGRPSSGRSPTNR